MYSMLSALVLRFCHFSSNTTQNLLRISIMYGIGKQSSLCLVVLYALVFDQYLFTFACLWPLSKKPCFDRPLSKLSYFSTCHG